MPAVQFLWNPGTGPGVAARELSMGKMPRGAVVSVSLRQAVVGAAAITVGADCLLPHVEFEPDVLAWGEEDENRELLRARGTLSVTPGGDTEALVYKWDPGCAVQLPWRGNLFLRGGTVGAGVGSIEVELRITYCGPKPAADPTLTYLLLQRSPVQLARGIFAISSPIAQSYIVTVLGTAYTVTVSQSGPFGLGAMASGTIEVAPAGTIPAPVTTAYLRVG